MRSNHLQAFFVSGAVFQRGALRPAKKGFHSRMSGWVWIAFWKQYLKTGIRALALSMSPRCSASSMRSCVLSAREAQLSDS